MILINTLAIVGCVVAGRQVYNKMIAAPKHVTLADKLVPKAYGRRWREEKENPSTSSGHRKPGPFFSLPAMLGFGKDERRQNLEDLSDDTPEISDAEQRIDHYLAVSFASLGIAVAGSGSSGICSKYDANSSLES